MYESLQVFAIFLLTFAIGEIVYATLVNPLVEALGKKLSKQSFALFQAGLALIGSIDWFGASAVALGIVLCFLAVLLDLLETFSE
jgi:hypothetical protein